MFNKSPLFRYFACGLNGYVGMIDFNSHQWIKYGFVAFAVAIALASLLFSNKLVRELTIEERNKIEIWAKATEHLATETDNSDMNLVLRILQGNTTIPVILYDKSNRSFIVNNIKLPDKGRDRFLQKKMEAFSKNEMPLNSPNSINLFITMIPTRSSSCRFFPMCSWR